MQNNRDRLQAHRFVVGRLVNAMVSAEPDSAVAPMRRATRGWFYGLMVAVLVVAGFAIYGLIRGGGEPAWRTGDMVILDKETGTRYILLGDRRRLHPVLNLTSALLAIGSGKRPDIVAVSESALNGFPRGDSVGIPGAPDVLPDSRKLATGPWTACQTAHGGRAGVHTTLILGGKAGYRDVDDGQGVVVSTPDDTRHLIWQGRRFTISSDAVAVALGLGNVQPLPVRQRWVDLFPARKDLRSPDVSGKGRRGPVVAGRPGVVGQVFQARTLGGAVSYYLLLPDGMQPVTVTMAAILAADPSNARLYDAGRRGPIAVSAADIAAVPSAGSTLMDGGWPATPPAVALSAGDNVVPCALVVPRPDGAARVRLGAVALDLAGQDAPDQAEQRVGPDPVSVEVGPGGGALVTVLSDTGIDRRVLYLITDQGRKYPVGSADMAEQDVTRVAATLGYGGGSVHMPGSIVDLIPVGPALDPVRARQPQTGVRER